MQLSDATRAAVLDAIDTAVTGASHVRFFVTGGATPGTKCASITCNNPTFLAAGAGTATSGQMDLDVTPALSDTTPAASGTVTRLCFYTNATAADNAWHLQLGIGTTGGDVTMSNNAITTGDTVQLTSLRLSCPAGTPSALP